MRKHGLHASNNNNMQNMHHGLLLQGPQLNYSHSWSRACNFGLLPNFFYEYNQSSNPLTPLL